MANESNVEVCYECGGAVEPLARAGRLRSYRGDAGYAVPAEMAIPTCRECGRLWMTRGMLAELDGVFAAERERRSRAQLVVSASLLSASFVQMPPSWWAGRWTETINVALGGLAPMLTTSMVSRLSWTAVVGAATVVVIHSAEETPNDLGSVARLAS